MSDMLEALVVREKDGKSWWTKIGVAFPNRDGTGYLIRLEATPLDGVIHLRPKRAPKEARSPVHREPGDDAPQDDVSW